MRPHSLAIAAFLVVHSYSVAEDFDSDFALADGPAAIARVYTVAVVPIAEVALLDSKQLVHSKVVLDAVVLVVVDYACYLTR